MANMMPGAATTAWNNNNINIYNNYLIGRQMQQAQLQDIIFNGYQFLRTLEQFAQGCYPENFAGTAAFPGGMTAAQPATASERPLTANAGATGASPAGSNEENHHNDNNGINGHVAAKRPPADAASPADAKRRRVGTETNADDAGRFDGPNEDSHENNQASASNNQAREGAQRQQQHEGKQPKQKRGAVYQYCSETGAPQGFFKDAKEAAKAYVRANPETDTSLKAAHNGISKVLLGIRPKYRKHYFRREYQTTPMPHFPIRRRRPNAPLYPDPEEEKAKSEVIDKRRLLLFCATTGKCQGDFPTAAEAARAHAAKHPGTDPIKLRKGLGRVLSGEKTQFRNLYVRRYTDTSPMPKFPIRAALIEKALAPPLASENPPPSNDTKSDDADASNTSSLSNKNRADEQETIETTPREEAITGGDDDNVGLNDSRGEDNKMMTVENTPIDESSTAAKKPDSAADESDAKTK